MDSFKVENNTYLFFLY